MDATTSVLTGSRRPVSVGKVKAGMGCQARQIKPEKET